MNRFGDTGDRSHYQCVVVNDYDGAGSSIRVGRLQEDKLQVHKLLIDRLVRNPHHPCARERAPRAPATQRHVTCYHPSPTQYMLLGREYSENGSS